MEGGNTGPDLRRLRAQLEESQQHLLSAQVRVLEAEQCAARAEKAARYACVFARTMMHRPSSQAL